MVYTPAKKPWPHQEEALRRLDGKEGFALFMAMRTGKTKVTLDDYGRNELAGKVRNLCVIAPGGVYKTWAGACDDHFSYDLKSRALIHTWQSGSSTAHAKALDRFMSLDHKDRPRVLLINVEAISAVQRAKDTLIDFLKFGPVMTAIDESTIIKNPQSKRTKFINKDVALQSELRRILCGLPTPRSPLDLYCQMEFLDWRYLGFRSYYAFRANYAFLKEIEIQTNHGPQKVPIVTGFRELDDLSKRLEPHSFRVKLEDVYDVPPKIYMIREVKMTTEQARIYKEMKQFCTAMIETDSHITSTIIISQLSKLHQILCGHVIDDHGQMREIPENRTNELIELLSEYDGKAIIWCSYDADVQKVANALKKEYGDESVSRFWGGNTNTREAEEFMFKTNPERRFMVATASAGGRGREWSLANLIVYYSNTDNLEHRDQSEERGQIVGKTDNVTYVDLMVPGTIDEKYVHALRKKINMATAITRDNYREWLV